MEPNEIIGMAIILFAVFSIIITHIFITDRIKLAKNKTIILMSAYLADALILFLGVAIYGGYYSS